MKHWKIGKEGFKMDIKYNYYECEKFETQYEDYDFEESKVVEARYVKALVDCDIGNPYIEALPHPRKEEDVRDAYTKHLLTYNYDNVKQMSKLEKMLQVSTLRQLRFPLTFHKNLEFSFYNAIITSYRSRKIKSTNDKPIEYISNDTETETNCVLCGNSADSTNAGFSLIGYSGCGKSSAIQTLLAHYPQTIIHHIDNFTQYVQIVYLVVNCVPNSNFSALYEGIGDAIDKALGNTHPVYAREIANLLTLGKKMEKIRELIERFGIGIIIFDEIQLINFDRTKESSFEALMTLSNRTKVAMAVVGTEDARDKMFRELRTTRRIGTVINGNLYCDNKKFFSFLTSQLFQYQWFDEPIELTDELVDALYDVSKGIIDQLIGIYSCMHYDYLERKNRPIIDAQYVKDIAQRYYPGIQLVLAELESVEAARKLMSIRQDAEVRVAAIIDSAKQEKESEDLLEKQTKAIDKMLMLKNIVANITALYEEYSLPEIEKAFNLVMKQNKDNLKSERDISRLVLDKLMHQKKNKSVSKKKKSSIPDIDTSTMRDFISE